LGKESGHLRKGRLPKIYQIVLSQGHDLIDFRKSSFSQMAALLSQDRIRKIQTRFASDSNPWTKTTPPFTPAELGLIQGSIPCQVKALFFPFIGQATCEPCQEAPRGWVTTVLLQMLTWPLLGVETFVLDNFGRVICPSAAIEPTRGWKQAYDFVNFLASRCPAYIVHAPLESVLKFTAQTICQVSGQES